MSKTVKIKPRGTCAQWSDSTIVVKKMGLDQTTMDGAYWVEVLGNKIGEKGRTHWTTPRSAWLCGYRFWMRVRNT